MKKINKKILIGLIVFVLFVGFILIYPLVSPYDQFQMNAIDRLQSPNAMHPLGTDDYGRDLLTRICFGAQISILIGLSVAIVSCCIGSILGMLAGQFKVFDQVFMRLCDGLAAIPGILLAMALMAILGSSAFNLFLALTLISTPKVARIIRSETLAISHKSYIEGLRVIGASPLRITMCHIVPNILSIILVQFTLVFAEAVLSEASLSFLGLGVDARYASLGSILETGKNFYAKAWWIIVFAGIALVIAVWSLGMLSEGMNEQFTPQLARKKRKKRKTRRKDRHIYG